MLDEHELYKSFDDDKMYRNAEKPFKFSADICYVFQHYLDAKFKETGHSNMYFPQVKTRML